MASPEPLFIGRPAHRKLPRYNNRQRMAGGSRIVCITLSRSVLDALDDRVIAGKGSRSELIERYVAAFVSRKRRAA